MKYRWITLLFVPALVLSACAGGSSPEPQIEVQDPWARAVKSMGHSDAGEGSEGGEMQKMGANSAAYMLLRNTGGAPDKLLSADSDVAEAVELHISEMKDDVMSMRQVEYIEVPAKGETELKQGGLHVMMIGLTQDLVEGDTITLTLEFEQAGTMTVEAEVRAP